MKYIDTFKERHPKIAHHLSTKLVTVARYHLAGLFILSGITKAIDPFGLSLKLGEYFSAFGLDFLGIFDVAGAILLPSLELLVGFMLLGGLSRWIASWLAFVSMSFFTVLTLWLAVTNPISDCGCFGEIIKLTNWDTFFKNLAFYPFAIVLFLARNVQQRLNPSVMRTWVSYVILVPLSFGLSLYSYNTLPLIDPTPFKIGVNIPHAMTVQENDTHTVLVYKDKIGGELRDFSIEDTTWYDSARWEYVDTKTTGHSTVPEISTVPMFDGNIDRSAEILERRGYTLIFVVNDYDSEYEPRMISLSGYMQDYGGRVVALSAIDNLPASLTYSGIEILSSDYTLLQTMIQHRVGGAILLRNGTIVDKWSMNHLPSWKEGVDITPLSNVLASGRMGREELLALLFAMVIGMVVVSTVCRVR